MSSSLAPGTVLRDTYRVERLIAEGGMGAVYEAKHLRLGDHRVAIKVLLPQGEIQGDEMSGRFRREAEICAKLSHPNIIAVTDWDTMDDGTAFFVMEFLEGEDLAVRMRRGTMTHPEVQHIVSQIGAALDAAHARGVVHRDLKPRNIFLVATGGPDHVKVLDFGISKLIGDETLATTTTDRVLGSPRYMSPEQARGLSRDLGPLSDQFSLGSIAYELYAGRPAFAAATIESTMFNIVHEDPEPLLTAAPDAPPSVIAAITRALSKEPDARFSSTRELIHAMYPDHSMASLVELPPPPSGPAPPHPADAATVSLGTGDGPTRNVGSRAGARPAGGATHRRRSTLLWALVPLVGVAVGVGGVALLRQSRAPESEPDLPAVTVANDEVDPPEPETGVERPPERRGGKGKTGRTKRPPADQPATQDASPIPAEAREKLERAREYLAAGDAASALRLAQQSVGLHDSPPARKLIVEAYCAKNDLEMAHASLHKVAPADVAEVRKFCEQQGVLLRR